MIEEEVWTLFICQAGEGRERRQEKELQASEPP
jgi:hypothetical protein